MDIVDTTIWIDMFNAVVTPHTTWLRQNLSERRIRVLDLIFCEVLQGFRDDARFLRARDSLIELGVMTTGGEEFALQAAVNYRTLRRMGITIRKTMDNLIATECIRGGHRLLHNDRDFDPFEKHLGLKVIHP